MLFYIGVKILTEKLTANQLLLLYLIEQINSSKILQGMMMFRQSIFLLSKENVFTYNDFITVSYGDVFSKTLQNDIDCLIKRAIIEKKVESGPYTRMYSFVINEKKIKQSPKIDGAPIDAFLSNLKAAATHPNNIYESDSFEYYEKISEKLKYDVKSLLVVSTKNTDNRYTWTSSFLSTPDNNSCNLYYVAWFPLGPIHFKQIQRDIKRQAPCIFEQKVPQTGVNLSKFDKTPTHVAYSSKVVTFLGYATSQILQTDEYHIEYVISSLHGDIGIELHRDGTIICGINEQVLDKQIQETLKEICNSHIFSIMSEIQVDMMIYSEGSGVQKTLNPPGNLFALCEYTFFDKFPSKIKDYGEYRLKYVQSLFCTTTDAPHFVKSLMVYRNIIQSIDNIISELFNIMWIIWGYDLEKLNNQLLGHASTKQLKLIQEKTGKINKDFIDMNLIIEYLSDVIEKRNKEICKLDISKLGNTDIIASSKLLEWKIDDLRRILSSSIEYHGKINELLNAKYDEILSESEQSKNNSLNILNFILFGVFAYPIIVDAIPKGGIATHIFLTIGMCVFGYGIFKSSMYTYSKFK